MLNPLCYVSVAIYFEIKNSEMYGGEGSIGYSSARFGGVRHPEDADDDFLEYQRRVTAEMAGVSVEDVTVISKEAYDAATEEYDE